MKQEEHKSGKRVSFLMPYIDFCFMLIIIFVGMLSIAYFEPLGRTEVQTKNVSELNMREGKFEIKPVGSQAPQLGAGEKTADATVRPLTAGSRSSAVASATKTAAAQLNKKNSSNTKKTPQSGTPIKPSTAGLPRTPQMNIPAVATQSAVLDTSQATGTGDHFYLDLRGK